MMQIDEWFQKLLTHGRKNLYREEQKENLGEYNWLTVFLSILVVHKRGFITQNAFEIADPRSRQDARQNYPLKMT